MLRSPELRGARKEIDATSAPYGRRLFLQLIAGAGVAAAAQSVLGEETQPSEPAFPKELEPRDVNRHLHRIPLKLPHVVDRRERLTKDAKHGIVVIRQIHWADSLGTAGADQVTKCQREIEDLLKALLKGKWIDSGYAEGRMTKDEPATDARYSTVANAQQQGLSNVPEIAELGADRILDVEARWILHGGERTKTYDAAGLALSMAPGPEQQKLLYDDREDVLLGIVIDAKDRISCTVWGANHNFDDNAERLNLDAWNEGHPDHLVSVLTLTTTTVAENDRVVRKLTKPAPASPVPPPPEPDPELFMELPPAPAPKPVYIDLPTGKEPLEAFIDLPR